MRKVAEITLAFSVIVAAIAFFMWLGALTPDEAATYAWISGGCLVLFGIMAIGFEIDRKAFNRGFDASEESRAQSDD